MNRQLNPSRQGLSLDLECRLRDRFQRGLHNRSMATTANEVLQIRQLGIGWAADHRFTVPVFRRLERLHQTVVAGIPKP